MADLSPERWERVQTILERVVDLTDGARRDYLDETCADDTALRREVESLLAVEIGVDGFLAQPPRPDRALDADDDVEIDRYRILRRLGAGGMGVVYLAERADDAFHQRVAVKVIKRGLDTDDFVRRFRVERQALANLQHPNIARLIDGGATADGRPYLVIEHVDGLPIDRYCEEHQVDVRARIELFAKVCDAVAHAHRNLIVHRDLKPSNVLVDASGEPKLLDFGVAKVFDPDLAVGTLAVTATGHRLMTPRYASPEQVRGETVTTATDVYALGVVLYELLAGCTPYGSDTGSTAELERRVCEQEPRRPSAAHAAPTTATGRRRDATRTRMRTRVINRELRGDLDTIVLKTLRKRPDDRYATVDQLAADLRHYLACEPISARPPGVRYRLASFVRRRRAALRAAGLGLGLGIVATAALVVALLVLPRMSAEARRDAHAILLGPDQQAAIFDAVFFLGSSDKTDPDTRNGRDRERDLAALTGAERLYDRALRLNPFDEVSRREREVVRAARRLRQVPRAAPIPAEVMDMLDPSLATLLRDEIDADRVPSPATRRELGLLLLLARPGPEGIEALRAYEAVEDPDPLVEGLLGQLYLALGHADLAYPRLRAAYESYPATRAMALGLAEAASGVRDHARAMRLIEIASDLPGADPFDRLSRVRAQALAAAGHVDEARRAFEHATRSIRIDADGMSAMSNPVSCFEFGRFLDRHGDTEPALRAYARGNHFGCVSIERAPGVVLVAYVDLMERWVAGWSADERSQHLSAPDAASPLDTACRTRGVPITTPFGLRDKLRFYVAARKELPERRPRVAVWPEQAERYAAERRGWSEETEASRLARQLGVE